MRLERSLWRLHPTGAGHSHHSLSGLGSLFAAREPSPSDDKHECGSRASPAMRSETYEYSGVALEIDYGAKPESRLVLTMHYAGGQHRFSMMTAQARQLLDLLTVYVRSIEGYKSK